VSIISGIGILVIALETGFFKFYEKMDNPNLFYRSVDTFFGGKNKDQSRELREEHNGDKAVLLKEEYLN